MELLKRSLNFKSHKFIIKKYSNIEPTDWKYRLNKFKRIDFTNVEANARMNKYAEMNKLNQKFYSCF